MADGVKYKEYYNDVKSAGPNGYWTLTENKKVNLCSFNTLGDSPYTQCKSTEVDEVCHSLHVLYDSEHDTQWNQQEVVLYCKEGNNRKILFFNVQNKKKYSIDLDYEVQVMKSFVKQEDTVQNVNLMVATSGGQLKVYSLSFNKDWSFRKQNEFTQYDFISLDVEDLVITEFEYYDQFNMLLIADNEGFVHFSYLNDTVGIYQVKQSYEIPKTTQDMLLRRQEIMVQENYVISMKALNTLDAQRVALVFYTGDVFVMKFFAKNRNAAPEFKYFSSSRNEIMDMQDHYYEGMIAYDKYNDKLAIPYLSD